MKYYLAIAFLLSIATIFFGMHYYVLSRIFGFFGSSTKIWLYALILALIFPIATIIDRTMHSPPTVGLYYFAGVLAGAAFISVFVLLLFEIINIFTTIFYKITYAFIILGIIFILSIFSLINAATLRVHEVEIPNFGKEMRIVQLSDVHVGTLRNNRFLERISMKTNYLKPDIVVITGDLFDGSGKLDLSLLEPLTNIDAPIYMIMGNHEFYEGENNVIRLMNQTNVSVLRNNVANVKGIQIIGLDYSENKSYVREELKILKFNTSEPSILLNHVPIGYEDAQNAGIKLQLSGHTHAGQIFPFTLAVRTVFPKYKGLYNFENFSLYVSQGTGTWGPPMRLGTQSEITLLKLRK